MLAVGMKPTHAEMDQKQTAIIIAFTIIANKKMIVYDGGKACMDFIFEKR